MSEVNKVKFNLCQVVSSDDLNMNADAVLSKLEHIPEMLIFSHNQPQFVIMTLQQYDLYTSKTETPVQRSIKDGKIVSKASEVKIGVFVRESIRKLIHENTLPRSEIEHLTDAGYCSATFGLSYPVLKPYDSSRPFDEQKRDSNNKYNRYYNFILDSTYGQYLLCSQWVEQLHRSRFEKWLSQWK